MLEEGHCKLDFRQGSESSVVEWILEHRFLGGRSPSVSLKPQALSLVGFMLQHAPSSLRACDSSAFAWLGPPKESVL